MKTNYVLIDYESVQPEMLSVLNRDNFKVIVFVGAPQAKISFEIAAALQKMGDRGDYIKITGSGPNALDFHIAFYIGQISALDSDTYFHIVSNDKGFDPLIAHLKYRKIFASRSSNVKDIPLIKAESSSSPAERVEVVLTDLIRRGNSKPRTLKTLSSTIQSLFLKKLAEIDVAGIIDILAKDGVVKVNGTKVTYNIPAEGLDAA